MEKKLLNIYLEMSIILTFFLVSSIFFQLNLMTEIVYSFIKGLVVGLNISILLKIIKITLKYGN